jgi:Pyridoxamine 5'-phosphate oxidase
MPQPDLASAARAIIDGNSYLTIATADRAGRPWASPLWYAHAGHQEFFWISSPAARHSRNLAERPQAGIVIFDSRAPIGDPQAVYLTVTACEVPGDRLAQGIEVFSARSQAHGARKWALADVREPAPHRLYRATTSECFLLDRLDQRIAVVVAD